MMLFSFPDDFAITYGQAAQQISLAQTLSAANFKNNQRPAIFQNEIQNKEKFPL